MPRLQWVVDGYALALAALLLTAGTLGDLRGHKRVALGGLVLFGLASLACGAAPGLGSLIAARAVQGAGAALVLPATLAIVTRTFPEHGQQARAIGIWAGVGSTALPAGPLLGGALVQGLGWRVALLAAFLAVERIARDPMFPLDMLRRPAFTRVNAVAGAMNLGTLGLLFLLTLYLQSVQHRSALAAGFAVLPLFLPLVVSAPISGRITARLGPAPQMTAGLLVAAGGIALLARLSAGSGYLALLPALLAWGGRAGAADARGRGRFGRCGGIRPRRARGRGQQQQPPGRRCARHRRLRRARRITGRPRWFPHWFPRGSTAHHGPVRRRSGRHRRRHSGPGCSAVTEPAGTQIAACVGDVSLR